MTIENYLEFETDPLPVTPYDPIAEQAAKRIQCSICGDFEEVSRNMCKKCRNSWRDRSNESLGSYVPQEYDFRWENNISYIWHHGQWQDYEVVRERGYKPPIFLSTLPQPTFAERLNMLDLADNNVPALAVRRDIGACLEFRDEIDI